MRRVSLARICWLSIELSFGTVEAWLAMLPVAAAAASAAERKERGAAARLMLDVAGVDSCSSFYHCRWLSIYVTDIHIHTCPLPLSLSISVSDIYIYISDTEKRTVKIHRFSWKPCLGLTHNGLLLQT